MDLDLICSLENTQSCLGSIITISAGVPLINKSNSKELINKYLIIFTDKIASTVNY